MKLFILMLVCILIYVIALACLIISAIRYPREFTEALNSLLDDIFGF